VSHLHRQEVQEKLTGQVPADVVESAREGIGVIHVAAGSLEPGAAAKAIDGANMAFVDAMTTGFWVSVGFIALGLPTSLLLLPKRVRVTQVVRAEQAEIEQSRRGIPLRPLPQPRSWKSREAVAACDPPQGRGPTSPRYCLMVMLQQAQVQSYDRCARQEPVMTATGQVALVTGASSGIGKAAATAFAAAGFQVIGTGRNTARVTAPAGVNYLDLDVTSDESVASVVKQVIDRFGGGVPDLV
jgi:hypothetical protein